MASRVEELRGDGCGGRAAWGRPATERSCSGPAAERSCSEPAAEGRCAGWPQRRKKEGERAEGSCGTLAVGV